VHPGFAEGELILETGGVQIVLPNGWEPLEQPSTYFVQKRARSVEHGIALSAGSIRLEMSLQQYAAVGAAGLVKGTESQLDFLATQTGLTRSEVDNTLASMIGRQLLEQVKQWSQTNRSELLRLFRQNLPSGTRYQIHSKLTMVDSGQVLYSRQFVLQGVSPGEIVTVTYVGGSAELFDQKDLADAIRPPAKTVTDAANEAARYYQRGIERGQQRDYQSALQDFNKAIELKPDYAEAYYRRGQAKGGLAKSRDDVGGALRDYNKAILLKPDYAEAYYNRGVAKQAGADFVGAIADYSKVIELTPDYAPAYEHRGKLRKSKGDLTGAQEDFNRAAELKSR
jgi:tetratricopeptide (TPR) repeat protein